MTNDRKPAPMKNFGFDRSGKLIFSAPRDPGFIDFTAIRKPSDFVKKDKQ